MLNKFLYNKLISINFDYRIFLIVTSINLISVTTCFPDPVYRSSDAKGVPVYSSKPKQQGAEPAKLPNIAKGKFGEIKPVSITCVGHGGINCQLGADTDGSVVCYDNFKDSIQRFAVSCGAAKLVIIPESYKESPQESSVVIRNSSAIAAKGIIIKGPSNTVLNGPKELEPYGSAMYSVAQHFGAGSKFEISCDNCP